MNRISLAILAACGAIAALAIVSQGSAQKGDTTAIPVVGQRPEYTPENAARRAQLSTAMMDTHECLYELASAQLAAGERDRDRIVLNIGPLCTVYIQAAMPEEKPELKAALIRAIAYREVDNAARKGL